MNLPTDDCKCPICGVPTRYESYRSEKEYEDCNMGCQDYSYAFHFGRTSVKIGDIETGYHYTTPLEERAAIVAQIDDEINKLKQNYPS